MMGQLKNYWHCIFAMGFFSILCPNHFAFTISPDSFQNSETDVAGRYTDENEFSEAEDTSFKAHVKDGIKFLKPDTQRPPRITNIPEKQIVVNSTGRLLIHDRHEVRTDLTQPIIFHHIIQTSITEIFQQPQLFGTLTALIGNEESLPEVASDNTLAASAFTTRENILILILTLSVLAIGTFLASPQRQKTTAKERSTSRQGGRL